MIGITNMSRREFLKGSVVIGGGLVIGISIPLTVTPGEAAQEAPFLPSAFLRIGADNSVTVIVNKSEMGQGVYTSLPMLVAEELECDWKKVRVEAAPVAPVYNHTTFGVQATGGSTSIRTEWERLSKAGAAAREMLIAAAAKRWQVEPSLCSARNGRVGGPGVGTLTYGELAEEAALLPVPAKINLKSPKRYTIIGKPLHRLDSPAKVNGTAEFGIDVTAPGMLTVLIARPPVFGGRFLNFRAEKAKAVPGIVDVVPVPSGVAVVATGFWAAQKGRDLLDISWDNGTGVKLSTHSMSEQYRELAKGPGTQARKGGDHEQALKQATRRLDAEYEVPFLAHAPMEPLNCFVDLRADRCVIRVGTQFQTIDRYAAAAVAGLKPEQVEIQTTYLGGGFGRRANPASDFVTEAVHVAKLVKKPVKVVWSRGDDMRGGYYRPMWYDRISAGLDPDGGLTSWQHTIVGQSIAIGTSFENAMIRNGIDATSVEGAQDIPYAIPNILVDLHTPTSVIPVLWWRSVGHSHTAFVVESFMDEVAHDAGKDPLSFRLSLLAGHPRHRGVLSLAAQKAGWGAKPPAGRARGIAVHESFGSFVAHVAEVSVGLKGAVRVHRVVCAIDCGRIVNPDIITAQMESGIAFGLSAALHGAITLKNGRVEQENFDSYPIIRMNEMPEVEVHIVPSQEPPGGVGEPGVPPIAPAVANALFTLTGARVRSLPITPDKVLQALQKG